jgi:two-component system OmpR family sensor kinase
MKTKYVHLIFILSIGLFIWLYSTMPMIKHEVQKCLDNPQKFEQMLHQNRDKHHQKKILDHIAFGLMLIILTGSYILLLRQIRKNNTLNESRKLFLRSIMHELKTPIAKGKIACEFIDDTEIKEKNLKYYNKLDTLIDQFASMEKLLNENYQMKQEDFYADEVIDHAIDLLMFEDTLKHIDIKAHEDFKIYKSDFELLCLAMKNLIDNGVKYSPEKKVQIEISKNKIIIQNQGEHIDTAKSNRGMGYGLQIVRSIIKLHGYKIVYNYIDGLNRFTIEFG